jgi:serine protease Do
LLPKEIVTSNLQSTSYCQEERDMAGVLEELERATTEVADRIGPAVVGIGHGWGLGSGVVVGEGVVLTNAHNVSDPGVTLIFADGRTAQGQVSGHDIDGDLATIAVDTSGVTPVGWAETPARVGASVFALANPGGRGLRVTLGTVAAVGRTFRGPRGRRVTGTIEHTAPLVKGSSGGPVLDLEGRLVGLNTNRLGEGFYAAIPTDAELKSRVDALARGESPQPRYLGIGLVPGRAARHLRRSVGLPDRDGVLVRVVEPDSPAAHAGVRQGDLIVEAAGRPVGIVRGTDDLSVSVTFGATREEGSA